MILESPEEEAWIIAKINGKHVTLNLKIKVLQPARGGNIAEWFRVLDFNSVAPGSNPALALAGVVSRKPRVQLLGHAST